MANSNGSLPITMAKRKRVRAVEELYLNGYCAKEIHDLIGKQFDVTYGTIRNDIVTVRKMWLEQEQADNEEGRHRYLATLHQIRRKAMAGWEERAGVGRRVVKGRDYELAHKLDKEIARLSGVTLASDARTIHLTIERAREYVDKVMKAVFKHVPEPDRQEAIIKELELLDAAGDDSSD